MHCIEFYTLEPIFNTKKYPTSYRSNFSPTPTTYRSILTNEGPYDRSLLKCRLPGVPMFNWNSPNENFQFLQLRKNLYITWACFRNETPNSMFYSLPSLSIASNIYICPFRITNMCLADSSVNNTSLPCLQIYRTCTSDKVFIQS